MADKKYNVYGLGNALVDFEFKVDNAFLKTHAVDKGLMTLVDAERQATLVEAIDTEQVKMQCGGSAANTMIAVAQFGGSAFYSCKVASDETGDFYTANLKDEGVASNLEYMERPDGITGKCLVMVTDDAERTMNTFLGITSDFSTAELDENAIKEAEYVYIEGYLVPSESGFNAMLAARDLARKNGTKLSLTFSDPNMVNFFKDQFIQLLDQPFDLVFCNEEEAMTFTGAKDLLEAREALKKVAKNFVITLGKNGAMLFDGTTFIDIEPHATTAVDSNGAGDMFAGAYLYGITNGKSKIDSAALACRAASKVVSQFGPRLSKEQAQELL